MGAGSAGAGPAGSNLKGRGPGRGPPGGPRRLAGRGSGRPPAPGRGPARSTRQRGGDTFALWPGTPDAPRTGAERTPSPSVPGAPHRGTRYQARPSGPATRSASRVGCAPLRVAGGRSPGAQLQTRGLVLSQHDGRQLVRVPGHFTPVAVDWQVICGRGYPPSLSGSESAHPEAPQSQLRVLRRLTTQLVCTNAAHEPHAEDGARNPENPCVR